MGDHQALLMIMFSQTPLSHTMFLLLVHHLHSHPQLAFDVPNNISEINDSTVDLGHESHMLNLLGGNNETFESLGYFRGYDAALDPYA